MTPCGGYEEKRRFHSVASCNTGHSSQGKKANVIHLIEKVDMVGNLSEQFAKMSISSNKNVSFSNSIDYMFYDNQEEKGYFRLLIIAEAYRRDVDRAAIKHGLTFAAGHDDYKKSPYPYNHEYALSEFEKLN
ncbi:hypothetical protein ACFFJN_02080 [Erwinia mallotivora]|uniref:hypothetical protein n=1 Tax=Erwinia mallotivora TaxID=69222 RepID=UPI0035E707C9